MFLADGEALVRKQLGRLSLGLMFVFSLTASAQEKVSFEWKFEKDKPFYQQMTTKTTQTMKVMGMDVNQTQEQTFYFKWTPVSQDKDGKWTLKQKIEGVKMKIDIAGNPITYDSTQPTPQGGANTALSDFFKAIVDAEFTLVLGKNNKVESVSGRKEFLDKLVGANAQMKPLLETLLTEEALKQMADPTFGMIPPEPKAVKDTWSVTTTLALGPIGSYETVYTFTYTGKDATKKDLEAISVDSKLTYKAPTDRSGEGLPFRIKSANLKQEEKNKKPGKILFDAKAGRIVETEMELKLSGSLEIEISGTPTTVELSQEQTTKVETRSETFLPQPKK